MKKKLIAFASLCVLCAAASAQSSVTLFGVVDLGIERTTLSPGGSVTALTSGIQSGSRWGLKGTEDLGGGLSASFRLEGGIDASTGFLAQGGRAFGRQAWVGLDGGFGSVKAGRQYTPLFIAVDTVDPFDAGITGDGSGALAVFRSYGVRMDNTITYTTPKLGDFSAQVAYGFGEVLGSMSVGSQVGLSGTYASGPLTVVGAYHHQNVAAGGVTVGRSRTAMIGAAYDLKAAVVSGAFAVNRDKDATGLSVGRSKDYMLGVSVPVGAATLLAEYVHHGDNFVTAADANYWQLGATYALSKRTNFYTSYSTIRNQSLGTMGSGAPGVDISWLNVGIRHTF
ncbi:porin [Ramlibacter sp. PS4R-6]|uniref:porin n=1 Tax=Ramlibacter sp. PS4R-6 TaxID=3133438 RepID=UPI00309CDF40